MINWFTPWGFLGLLGIAVLILIYIIKPNYQQKFISSTHVWKLSLKYRKKRIPISKLRNLLIILCQVLILLISAFMLAQPFLSSSATEQRNEKVLIIDASASMLATQANGLTRFEKAIAEAKNESLLTIESNGLISIIFAATQAKTIVPRTDSLETINAELDSLVCTYGEADIEGAMTLTEEILAENSEVEIVFFTAKTYVDIGEVRVENVADSEWNAAILNVNPVLTDNYYVFEVEVASFGENADLTVHLLLDGVNLDKSQLHLIRIARCVDNTPITVYFDEEIYLYSSAQVYIQVEGEPVNDSFKYDNVYYVYGGTKAEINVLYASSKRNSFFGGVLMGLQEALSPLWNIKIKEAELKDISSLMGYDFYIFEEEMPRSLPDDGVVFLVNPSFTPQGADFVLGTRYTNYDREAPDYALSQAASHPVMNSVNPQSVTVSQYTTFDSYEGYTPLINCSNNNDPVFLIKDEPKEKIAVLSFSLNMSTLAVDMSFPILMYNLFDYFLPPTITEYVFDVNEAINLNARGQTLGISGPGLSYTYTELPCVVSAPQNGVYTLSQKLMSGVEVSEDFYVKIARNESDFARIESLFPPLMPNPPLVDLDLLVFLAIGMVTFLFMERLLHIREEF